MNSTDIIEFEKKTYGSTPSYVFDKFWYFVAERQNIFFNRLNNFMLSPLSRHFFPKITN